MSRNDCVADKIIRVMPKANNRHQQNWFTISIKKRSAHVVSGSYNLEGQGAMLQERLLACKIKSGLVPSRNNSQSLLPTYPASEFCHALRLQLNKPALLGASTYNLEYITIGMSRVATALFLLLFLRFVMTFSLC